jgi:hypothetical protein
MPYTSDLVDELNTLIRYDLASTHQGVNNKGLLTQVDGGYLTSLGRNAAEHAQTALSLLTLGAADASKA